MSTWEISSVEQMVEGATEEERLEAFAQTYPEIWRVYKYRKSEGSDFTHYKLIYHGGSDQERAMFQSPFVHDPTLVYERGGIKRTRRGWFRRGG